MPILTKILASMIHSIFASRICGFVAVFIIVLPWTSHGSEDDFLAVVRKLEEIVLALRDQVEYRYAQRCSTIDIAECAKGNYDNCLSGYPHPICPDNETFTSYCGDGVSCGSLVDTTTTSVRLPTKVADGADNNPTDLHAIETICFTQHLNDWLVNKYEEDFTYWKNMGVIQPQMFYGSNDGVFRIFPARHSNGCGWFDPRNRPWFGAGSTGNKNIMLILDVSGSMDGVRLMLLKEAAKQVIARLAIGDRVAVVFFDSTAGMIANQDKYLFPATEANKEFLQQQIDKLEASGGTNFMDAFTKAFTIMQDSIEQEFHVGCNTMFLFLTDGEMTEPDGVNETSVLSFVQQGLDKLEIELGRPPMLFTYSVSESDDVHTFPKQLACQSGDYGVWNKISDSQNIVNSLNSYYLLLALSLGHESNVNQTAWTEPYFYDNSDVLGITVSAAVFDRSQGYPIFLGVVGVDFPLTAVAKALGVPEDSDAAIQRIVLASTARCPNLELTTCQLESFRRRGSAGDEALCTTNCTDFVSLEDELCSNAAEYPKQVFVDPTFTVDTVYEDMDCCAIAGTMAFSDEQCAQEMTEEEAQKRSMESSSGGLSQAAVVGISAGSALVALICFFFGHGQWKAYREKQGANPKLAAQPGMVAASPRASAPTEAEVKEEQSISYVRPPPVAPGFVHAVPVTE